MRAPLFACIASLALAGCFAPSYESEHLQCAAGAKPCPDGYHCAADQRCWRDGTDPAPPDLAPAREIGANDAGSDGATDGAPDLLPTPDLLMPPIVYPPATVWISSGGGSPIGSSSSAALNISVGGAVVVGGVQASGGGQILFGYFTDDTF
jgi:hypothetical protein